MNEEKIIKGIEHIIYELNDILENENEWYDFEEIESAKEQLKLTEGLLDLYNKQKAYKNKLINYIAIREDKTYEDILKEFELGE